MVGIGARRSHEAADAAADPARRQCAPWLVSSLAEPANGAPGGAAPPIARGWRARDGTHLPVSNGVRIARSQGRSMRGASQAPWRLPALHSPLGETEKGTGLPGAEQRIRAAERWLRSLVVT